MSEATLEMNCNKLVERITDYLEGALPPAEAARIDAHLRVCDGCQTYLDQMRQTIAALGHLPRESLSEEAERALLAAFRDWSSAR